MTTNTEHIIDAAGKSIGRVATEAAAVLNGKDSTSFAKNVVRDIKVRVKNAAALAVTDRKAKDTVFHRHTGYLGNAKKPTLRQIIDTKGKGAALVHAVSGMLPKNTLREKRLKNLIIDEN